METSHPPPLRPNKQQNNYPLALNPKISRQVGVPTRDGEVLNVISIDFPPLPEDACVIIHHLLETYLPEQSRVMYVCIPVLISVIFLFSHVYKGRSIRVYSIVGCFERRT